MPFLKKLPSLRWYNIRFEEIAFFEESADLKKTPFSPYFRCSENPLRRLVVAHGVDPPPAGDPSPLSAGDSARMPGVARELPNLFFHFLLMKKYVFLADFFSEKSIFYSIK